MLAAIALRILRAVNDWLEPDGPESELSAIVTEHLVEWPFDQRRQQLAPFWSRPAC